MKNRSLVYTILVILIWSTVATAFKLTLKNVTFDNMLFYSSFFSLISIYIVLIINKKTHKLKVSKVTLSKLILLALINPFLYYLFLFFAYENLKAQFALSLNYLWPIYLIIFSALINKNKFKNVDFISVFVSFVGVFIIINRGNLFSIQVHNYLGFIVAILSGALFALYWIFSLRVKLDNEIKLFYTFLFGTLYVAFYLFVTKRFEFIGLKPFLGSAYIGVFEMGITFFIWQKALELSTNRAVTSNLIFLSPFFSQILLYLILGEKIFVTTFIGLFIIISSIVIHNVYERKRGENENR